MDDIDSMEEEVNQKKKKKKENENKQSTKNNDIHINKTMYTYVVVFFI